jgi:membrane protease YdiL (CAAX protease family)
VQYVRVVVYLLAMLALVPVAGALGVPFAYPLLMLAATAVVYRLERRSLAELGLTPRPRILGLALLGLLVGAAMCVTRVGVVAGAFGGTLHVAVSPIVFLLSSVLVEELLFRGYVLRRLLERHGTGVALAIGAVAFGVYHWVQWGLFGDPVAMAFTLIATGSAHVLFAAAFLRSGTLWSAVGLHLGWNFVDQTLQVTDVPRTAAYLTGFGVSELLIAIVVYLLLRRGVPPCARPGVAR